MGWRDRTPEENEARRRLAKTTTKHDRKKATREVEEAMYGHAAARKGGGYHGYRGHVYYCECSTCRPRRRRGW